MADDISQTPEDHYSYDGWLVFNAVYQYSGSKSSLLESLPEYNEGSPADPGEGFVYKSGDTIPDDRFTHISYIREKYEVEMAYTPEKEEPEEVYAEDDCQVDIFASDDILLVRGTSLEHRRISTIFKNHLPSKTDQIQLTSDYLTWLFYLADQGHPLLEYLEIERITGASFLGGNLESAQISGSDTVMDSSVALNIFHGDIESITADFEDRGSSLQARISAGGEVHVKTAQALREVSDLKRMRAAVYFLIDLTQHYISWESDTPSPPPSFYEDLQDRLDHQGTDLVSDISSPKVSETTSGREKEEVWNLSLDGVIQRGESETIEFKSGRTDPETVVRELVALTNKRGGVVVYGITDAGEIDGIDNIEAVEEEISSRLDTTVSPRLECETEFRIRDSKNLLLFRVAKYRELPHAINGVFYTRRGTTKRKLTPYELSYLFPERCDSTRY